jgi:hypothetical protein
MATITLNWNSVNWLGIGDVVSLAAARTSPVADFSNFITGGDVNQTSEVKYYPNRDKYDLHRIFADFDISSIPIGSTITGITLQIYVGLINSSGRFHVIPGGALSGNITDFSLFDYASPKQYADFYPINRRDLLTIILSDEQVAFPIPGSNYFTLGFVSSADYDDQPGDIDRFNMETLLGVTSFPRVTITYDPPLNFTNDFIGISNANISKVSGTDLTSIQKINGV